MSEKRYFGFGEFGTWVRTQVADVMTALGAKADASSVHTKEEANAAFLGVADTAVNANQLEGVSKAQVINEALAAANLDSKLDADAVAVDSAKLGGQLPAHYATAAAVTQLEADVNTMLTDLTAAFNAGTETINAA